MNRYNQNQKQGLYDPQYEHDNCGVGFVVNIDGRKSHEIIEKGVEVPSNLQGLYRCEYEGDKLDYDATIKLLKTFNEFNLI